LPFDSGMDWLAGKVEQYTSQLGFDGVYASAYVEHTGPREARQTSGRRRR
jgi:hypothetical protein